MRGAYLERSVRGPGEYGVHLVEQEETAAACLLHGLLEDLAGKAADLDVHLQGGDAVAGSGHLEVHVAVVVFGAGDVSEDGVIVALLDQAHGDSGDGTLEGDAGVKERETKRRKPMAMEEEPLDSRMSETMRME